MPQQREVHGPGWPAAEAARRGSPRRKGPASIKIFHIRCNQATCIDYFDSEHAFTYG